MEELHTVYSNLHIWNTFIEQSFFIYVADVLPLLILFDRYVVFPSVLCAGLWLFLDICN